jgi:hypothetical protein
MLCTPGFRLDADLLLEFVVVAYDLVRAPAPAGALIAPTKNDLHKPQSSCQKKKEFVRLEYSSPLVGDVPPPGDGGGSGHGKAPPQPSTFPSHMIELPPQSP